MRWLTPPYRFVPVVPAPETIRELLAQGLDTRDIASRCGCREADIWNALSREDARA